MFKTKDAWMNFFYSFGAAIVILGAWLKITHITLGPINGNIALTVGLITEAIIFIIFAFDPPKTEESYAWENVYPELLDKHANPTRYTLMFLLEIMLNLLNWKTLFLPNWTKCLKMLN
jgi:gliding motility-associated protein GldL